MYTYVCETQWLGDGPQTRIRPEISNLALISTHLSICPSIHLSICPSIHLSILPPSILPPSLHRSMHPSIIHASGLAYTLDESRAQFNSTYDAQWSAFKVRVSVCAHFRKYASRRSREKTINNI